MTIHQSVCDFIKISDCIVFKTRLQSIYEMVVEFTKDLGDNLELYGSLTWHDKPQKVG